MPAGSYYGETDERQIQDTGLTLKNVLKKTWDIFEDSIETTLIQTAKEIPGVQKAIEEEKVKVGKNITWQAFPFVLIGGVLLFMIMRFK